MDLSVLPVCQICYDDIISGAEVSLVLSSADGISAKEPIRWNGCNADKKFCGTCVTQYLKSSLSESKFSKEGRIPCPCAEKCGASFGEDDVKQYLTDFELFWKYLLFSKRAQVESDPDCFFCPNPECGDKRLGGTIVRVSENRLRWRLKCRECGVSICKKCGFSHSVLMSCESVLDSGFQAWKYSTRLGVKVCPSCKYHIEKIEGCDHMTCRRCNHEFCWRCLSDYRGGCSRRDNLISCKMVSSWDSPKWGTSPVTRGAAKTSVIILALPAIGAGSGVVVAGAACMAAAGCIAVPVVTFLSLGRLLQQGVYYMRSREFPVIVHMPWNRRVAWIESVGDGDGEAGHFLGYEGRHHPTGIFVARTTISIESNVQGMKAWLKKGPQPLSNSVKVVMYFVPNGTSKATLANMIAQYSALPMTAYPGCVFNIQTDLNRQEARNRLEQRVINILNEYLEAGHSIPKEHVMNGVMTDPTDYGLPAPEEESILDTVAYDKDIKRCPACKVPKYFTNMILFEHHMSAEHSGYDCGESNERQKHHAPGRAPSIGSSTGSRSVLEEVHYIDEDRSLQRGITTP